MGGELRLKKVSKTWDTFKLRNITLNIGPGEYFVLVGPTGSGKTLLLETIQGFHTVDKGSIQFDGQDITKVPADQRRIAYVPQTPNLLPQITVRENIEYPLKKKNLVETLRWEVDGVLQMLSLSEHQDREFVTLSGGEKRKVALARALVQQPRVLLLDEPLSNLDVTTKQEIRDEINTIHNYLGVTVIHVTHDQQEALGLADRLGVIRKGVIVKKGTVEDVFNDPTDEYAARFLGYQNIYSAKVLEKGRKITKMNVKGVILRSSKAPKRGQTRIGIHSDDISLHKVTPPATRDNLFRGVIAGYSDLGPAITVTVDIGIKLNITQSKRRFLEQNIAQGEEIWVQFTPEAVKQLKV
ncbi:MAG: ABC transporter ATP-binding protein [Candidatus Bathyarchaeota archaeon]|nr:ABC transporter ATP-binding protein [Candidatus Bathyarchaeota archaeon]